MCYLPEEFRCNQREGCSSLSRREKMKITQRGAGWGGEERKTRRVNRKTVAYRGKFAWRCLETKRQRRESCYQKYQHVYAETEW